MFPPYCVKMQKYLLLTILIQGPKQQGIDIDVFLKPLMPEMKILWKKGVPTMFLPITISIIEHLYLKMVITLQEFVLEMHML